MKALISVGIWLAGSFVILALLGAVGGPVHLAVILVVLIVMALVVRLSRSRLGRGLGRG